MIPDAFTTDRLQAERMCEAHYDDLRVMQQDERMMAMIGGMRDAPGTVAYLDRHIVHWTKHGFGFWLLRDQLTGARAGLAGLRHLELDGVDELELGYGFLPAFWGRGLATEIARECRRMGFEQLEWPSLIALTHSANVASQQVLRKIGMQHDGDIEHDGRTSMLFRADRPGGIP